MPLEVSPHTEPTRRSGRRCHATLRNTAVVALVAAGLLAASTVPAAAAAKYTRVVTARQTVTVHITEPATESITASASAGDPAITKSATVRVSTRVTATVRATATARRRATASSPAKARALALSRARAVARMRAIAKASRLARSRASAGARSTALAQATTQAKARALDAARSAALTRGSPNPPVTTPAAPCGGETPTAATGETWTCTFDDEFNGTTLDSKNWSAVTTAGSSFGNTACFVDDPSTISVSGGTLHLTARRTATPFTCTDHVHGNYTTQYASGSVTSTGKFAQEYGTFAVRAKFPATTIAGLQSSLWMWPTDATKYGAWPLSGELDIAEEYSGLADRAIPYLHYQYDPATSSFAADANLPTNNYCMINNVNAFHEYAMTWTPTTITIAFDGQTCLVDHYHALGLPASAPFDQPFFMILTQGLGIGTNAFNSNSTPLPATTEIDYVRAWKSNVR